MNIVLISLLITCVITIVSLIICWYSLRWKYRKLPGPKPLPIIGNLLPFLTSNDDFRKVLRNFTHSICDQIEPYGLGVVYFGPKVSLFITKPEFVSEILRDTSIINKGEDYDYIKPWLGDGLITSNGKKWKQKRKLLSPTFHSQILEEFIPAMNEEIDKMLVVVQKMTDKEFVDIRPVLTKLTLDIVSTTTMSVSLEAQSNANQEYIHSFNEVLLLFMRRVFSLLQKNDHLYRLTSDGKKFFAHCDRLQKHTLNILKNKKQEINDNTQYNKRMSFMDLLIKSQKIDPSITDEDIREHVDTFMFAGHDTSAVCLKWTLLLLGNDKRVQEKIREELTSIFGDDNRRQIDKDDLSKMHYIECVLKESLRLYPPVPIIQRLIDKEVTLGRYSIPYGMTTFVHLHKSLRNENYFPNPDSFIPERFLDMASDAYQLAYTPFATGPRNCIGQRFAMIEMKLILAKIFRNYTIEAMTKVQEVDSVFEVVYKPINEIRIKFVESKLN